MQIQILTSISKEEKAQNRDFSHKYLVVKLPLRLETFDDWTKYLPRVLVCILRFQESDMLEPRLKFRLAGWRRVSNRSTFWFLSSPVVISRTTVAFIGFKFHRFRKKKKKKRRKIWWNLIFVKVQVSERGSRNRAGTLFSRQQFSNGAARHKANTRLSGKRSRGGWYRAKI